ncbi:MAG: CAP domain-containing protein [Bacteroidales bacterium]
MTFFSTLFFILFVISFGTAPPVADPVIPSGRLSNGAYADLLESAGWPVDMLNTGSDNAYLSDEEKNMILAMNLIRHDPEKYAEMFVGPAISYYRGTEYHFPGRKQVLMTREGVAPARELYLQLASRSSLPLFYPSEGMSRAAGKHAREQSRTGLTGHGGQGGMQARIEREGQWSGRIAENIAYGNPSAHEAILGLMIDDGVPGRGHRDNMLNETFRLVGVAWDTHPRFPGGVYVVKYASAFSE